MSDINSIEFFATFCFGAAILHTFSVKAFQHIALRYPPKSVKSSLFHLLGEIEIAFGIWAAVFLVFLLFTRGRENVIEYIQTRNFTEPAFVFVILIICSTRPILYIATRTIDILSNLLPVKKPIAFYVTCLIIGPLMGSLITESAAMTVTALILLERFYTEKKSEKFMYATLGLLFVNISIGGTLTPYAAPPILMVASKWHWDITYMIVQFGQKAALSIVISTTITAFSFRKELGQIVWNKKNRNENSIPIWVCFTHICFLALIVINSHYMAVFVSVFLFFLGLFTITVKALQPPVC